MMVDNSISLVGWLGIGGFALGILNLLLLLAKHRKDKPIIKIEKNSYKKHQKFWDMDNTEYTNKTLSGEFNNGVLNYGIRELVVNITNKGHRDAKLKSVLPLYKQKGRDDFSPKVINFFPTTIIGGDREEIHLFFEFPSVIINEIEKSLPNVINVRFDFAHKKIEKKFILGKNPFKEEKDSV